MSTSKVFVSGCFDLFHSGHVEFLRQASLLGDVYVGVGKDRTVELLKGKNVVNSQEERLLMVKQCRYVKDAFINSGCGILDFEGELKRIMPDFFFVNTDGDNEEKKKLCNRLGIIYKVGERTQQDGISIRSTTDIVCENQIPYRIDLGGGWLDQPRVNSICPGSVITISVEPDTFMQPKSGYATSTRNKAIDLWGNELPVIDKRKMSIMLFSYDNIPGEKKFLSGSQDAFGICYPGLNKLCYSKGSYIPGEVISVVDETVLQFLENHIRVLNVDKRTPTFNVVETEHLLEENVKNLSKHTNELWKSILNLDPIGTGEWMSEVFLDQLQIYPNMRNDDICDVLNKYKNDVFGYKVLGAGGGGGILLFTDKDIPQSNKIRIRR